MYRMRLSNGVNWAHEFNATCGNAVKAGCEAAFIKYNADHAEDFFKFSAWLNEQINDIDLWYQQKLLACNDQDRAALDGQRIAWIVNARSGRRYGRQIMAPIANPKSVRLELHVQCPVRGDWLNPTPEVSNREYGPSVTPYIGADLTIHSWKKYQSFEALYECCAAMAEHSRNLAGLCDWLSNNAFASKQPPKLTIVKNDV